MLTVKLLEDAEKDPRVKDMFDDIRATRKSDFINNFWLYLAFDPQLLGGDLVECQVGDGSTVRTGSAHQ